MTEHNTAPAGEELEYAFKPSLLGAAREFKLTRSGLEWQFGRHSGRIPFHKIRRVRMSYRPATLQPHRFITEIWADDVPRISIVSASQKSMIEMERFDTAYAAFVAELHRRIADAGGTPRLEHGSNPLAYWFGCIIFAGAALGFAAIVYRSINTEAWSTTLFIVVFFGYLLWQTGSFIRRNRPGVYRLDALPAALMPVRQS